MKHWGHLNKLMEMLGDEDRKLLQRWLADAESPVSDELYFAAAVTGRMVLELKAEATRLESLHVQAIAELHQARDTALRDISQAATSLTHSIDNATASQSEGLSELSSILKNVVRTESQKGSSAALIVGANRVFEAIINRLQQRITLIALLIAVMFIVGAFFAGRVYGANGAQTMVHGNGTGRR